MRFTCPESHHREGAPCSNTELRSCVESSGGCCCCARAADALSARASAALWNAARSGLLPFRDLRMPDVERWLPIRIARRAEAVGIEPVSDRARLPVRSHRIDPKHVLSGAGRRAVREQIEALGVALDSIRDLVEGSAQRGRVLVQRD